MIKITPINEIYFLCGLMIGTIIGWCSYGLALALAKFKNGGDR